MRAVVGDQKEVEAVKYPKLMIHEEGMIVLFTNRMVGMVVSPGILWGIGDTSTGWVPNEFKDYTGELKLSND